MNPVVTLRIIWMNPSPTKMSKEGSSHPGQITRLHNNSHCPRKVARSAPSSKDQQSTQKRVPRAILQGPQVTSHKDQPLQHLQHGMEDHHRLPQSPNQVQASRIHWKCNDTNGSTKAPTNGKGPGATKSKKASTNADASTQPSNTFTCSQCGKSGH